MRIPCGDDFLVNNTYVVMVSCATECQSHDTEVGGVINEVGEGEGERGRGEAGEEGGRKWGRGERGGRQVVSLSGRLEDTFPIQEH